MDTRKVKDVELGWDREVPCSRREASFLVRRPWGTITGSSRLTLSAIYTR
jgi:hypothetical protein